MRYRTLATNVSLNHVIWCRGCEDMPILKQRYHWNSFATFDIQWLKELFQCLASLSCWRHNITYKIGKYIRECRPTSYVSNESWNIEIDEILVEIWTVYFGHSIESVFWLLSQICSWDTNECNSNRGVYEKQVAWLWKITTRLNHGSFALHVTKLSNKRSKRYV